MPHFSHSLRAACLLAMVALCIAATLLHAAPAAPSAASPPPRKIGILQPGASGETPALQAVKSAMSSLRRPGEQLSASTLGAWVDAETSPSANLLVLVEATAISPRILDAIQRHLARHGDLLVIGPGPACTTDTATTTAGLVPDPLGRASAYAPISETGPWLLETLRGSQPEPDTELPKAFWIAGHRPRGLGEAQPMPGRWIPWVQVSRGDQPQPYVIAATWLQPAPGRPLQALSHIGLPAATTEDALLRTCLRPVLEQLDNPTFIRAGMNAFCYTPGQPLEFGVQVVNRGTTGTQAHLVAELWAEDSSTTAAREQRDVTLPAGEVARLPGRFQVAELAEGDYRVVMKLLRADGRVLDASRHRFSIVKPRATLPEEQVIAKHGAFTRGGQPWAAQGLHYWMPFVAGNPDFATMNNWTLPALYDPDLAERDLRTIAALGLRTVVLPYHTLECARAVRDLLTRCQRHGLQAILFIGEADALTGDVQRLRSMVEAADLAHQPALVALDLAWEPHLGQRAARTHLDAAWTRWVTDQYGSVAAAAKVWGFAPRPAGNTIEGPLDGELTEDGPWRVMVAAYRRFLDDHISRGYGRSTRLLRELCPGVLLGVRTGYGGTGSLHHDDALPFDLTAGADHLDFIAPEGYALSAKGDGFDLGQPIAAYARLAGRHAKPVVWMEYGCNGWANGAFNEDLARIYTGGMLGLLRATQTGGFAWWWPGGYRVDEASDFGLSDLAGRPRAAARVLAEHAPALAWGPPPAPTRWIEVDRDLHPRGMSMLLQRHREEFMALVKAGEILGMRTAGTGKTTDDVPLTGVGGVDAPITPRKFINSEFEVVEFRAIDGTWRTIERDGVVAAAQIKPPLRLRVRVLNTGDAAWTAGKRAPGEVTLNLWRTDVEAGKSDAPLARQKLEKAVPAGKQVRLELTAARAAEPGRYGLRLSCKRFGDFADLHAFEVR